MITREEIFVHVKEKYGVEPDYPWMRTPNYAILRHAGNRKWFAAIVDVSKDKLGLEGKTVVDAINLKCDPILIGILKGDAGILPAYHMNKEHWITVLLDSPIPPEKVCDLIDLSYNLTINEGKSKKPKEVKPQESKSIKPKSTESKKSEKLKLKLKE
ncbi:hypothetical protein MsAg5_11690 [Methanosarcinaceae archaeon Ag5]|uniref:MmcQ/YjbR family DNA-binding protein n=1 Tax=Methanolapillus africanus TaxID=3028297 RepID=A0AAE4MKI7_9EURY|nr:hypothetical protein [Methanosarcinaceae archaeon Ag5]